MPATFYSRFRAGLAAFRESFVSSASRGIAGGALSGVRLGGDYDSQAGRMLRYEILWAYFENTAYANAVHRWAEKYKADYALYRDVRHVFSCGQRLGSFWGTHIWGGSIDPDCGDGKQTPSALPILTDHEALRPAIAKLFQDSNWPNRKDTVPLWGATMGDAAIKVDDDPKKGKPYLRPIDPRTLAEVVRDRHHNVISYAIEEYKPDPRPDARRDINIDPPLVLYREEADRTPGGVEYRTFLDGEPYPWSKSNGSAWTEPYPFIPMVLIQHWDVGRDWGWAEPFPILSKMREADSGPAALTDFILKSVDAPWLFKGIKQSDVTFTPAEPSLNNPRPNRYETPTIYGPADAGAQALITGLDIADCREFFADLRENLEDEYPELVRESKLAIGDASGRALRYARQRIEVKAQGRRAGYDAALTRAIQMALTLGGMARYEGYTDFDEGSFDRGDLDFRIGDRPVFQVDPVDLLERKQMFWQIAESSVRSGYPLETFLKDESYSDAQLAAFAADRDANDARMIALATAQAALRTPNPVNNAPNQAPTNGEAARQAAQRPGGM